jgi:hypothetical protein
LENFLLSRLNNTNSTSTKSKKVDKFKIIKERLTPRKESEKITKKVIPNKFLGKKGSAVYQQEFFSFCNIKSVGRDHNWSQKFKVLCEELEKNNPELLASLKIKYQHLDPKIR